MRIASMIPRYLMTLMATVCVYLGYESFVSPVLEGPASVQRAEYQPVFPHSNRAEEIKRRLAGYFPQDGWEQEPCAILETEQAKILFHDYTVQEDGSVLLEPLSLVMETGRADPTRSDKNPPVVLRAPDGAVLKFEHGLSTSGDPGELQSGRLMGEVQIYRPESQPGENDDLVLVTRDVQISPERIFTRNDCEFRFGSSYGKGRNLSVDLKSVAAEKGTTARAFAGVERIQLAKVYELVLHQEPETRLHPPGYEPPKADIIGDPGRSFRITCNGQVDFLVDANTIDFHDQVLARSLTDPGDQMSCHQLTVVLQREPVETTDDAVELSASGIRRLIAVGSVDQPAVIASATRQARVIAPHIDLDVVTRKVVLTGGEQVLVLREGQRISAREIRYEFTEDGRIGNAVMIGPGEFVMPPRTVDGQPFHCHWQKRLTLQESEGKKVISLERARVETADSEITSDEMHIWMWEMQETDSAGQSKWRFEPAKMFATGNVFIQAPELSGQCERAAAYWPAPGVRQAVRLPARRHYVGYLSGHSPQRAGLSGNQQELPALQSTAPPSGDNQSMQWQAVPVAGSPHTQSPDLPRDEHHQTSTWFTGTELKLQMSGAARDGHIEELTVEGNVVIQQREKLASGGDSTQLDLRGSTLRVVTQPNDLYRMYIGGQGNQPATVSIDKLKMQGDMIHLDQTANRIWVEGPGEMNLANTAMAISGTPDLANNVTRAGEVQRVGETTVSWMGGMVFDGQMIYFETAVASESRQDDPGDGTITTAATRSAAMSIALNQRVDFRQSRSASTEEVQATHLVLVGQMESAEVAFPDFWQSTTDPRIWLAVGKYDRNGNIVSNQEVTAPKATFRIESGEVECKGPGTVIARQKAGTATTRLASSSSNPAHELNFIRVDYDGSFQGNMDSMELTFRENVHTFFTESSGWDHVPSEQMMSQFPGRAMVMDCDQLVLAQWKPEFGEATMEMIATGNSRVRGRQFSAEAERISFQQKTGQVVIESAAYEYARIRYREPGQSREADMTARTITYNVDTGDIQVQRMKQIEYSQQGNTPSGR